MKRSLAKMLSIFILASSLLFAHGPDNRDHRAVTGGKTTLPIVTYNIEWLGVPSRAGLDMSRSEQIRRAAQDIINGGGVVYALQEIIIDSVNGNALNDLLEQLNSLDTAKWAGGYNEKFSFWWNPDFNRYPAQRQAFVYKTSVFSDVRFETLLTEEVTSGDNRFSSGRLPFMMTATMNTGENSQTLRLICLHLKCCTGHAPRRQASMQTLAKELNRRFRDEAVIVLGDLNVADEGGAPGEIAKWGLYDDRDNNGAGDYRHAAGSVTDQPWHDIDHILISDELIDEYHATPGEHRNVTLKTTVSDHKPIKTTLVFSGNE